MAVEITGKYLGALRVEMTHGPSGALLQTVAPTDNEGDGSCFSPTDLVAAALGSCMMTLMGIVAQRDGLDLSGTHFRIVKHMQTTSPRRVASLPITFHLPGHIPAEARPKLERAALTCPVHHSLHPDIESKVEFLYDL
jgi:putative redox protein